MYNVVLYIVSCSYAIALGLSTFMLSINRYSFCAEQSYDYPCASEVTRKEMGEIDICQITIKHRLGASVLSQTLAQQNPTSILKSINLKTPTKRIAPTMYLCWTFVNTEIITDILFFSCTISFQTFRNIHNYSKGTRKTLQQSMFDKHNCLLHILIYTRQ